MSDLASPIRLSVAAPAYNEAAGIEAVIANWSAFLSTQPLESFEIVVCDDGSTDGTGAILDRLVLSCPQLRPLHFARNQGAAAALNAAIAATKGDWVLLTDSDGQFAIESLPAMLGGAAPLGGQSRYRRPPEKGRGLRPVRHLVERPGMQFGAWQPDAGFQFRL